MSACPEGRRAVAASPAGALACSGHPDGNELSGKDGTMYSAMTHSIRIEVEPTYLEDQSEPAQDYYVWAYHIVIENQGEKTVQLRARHWKITDATGHLHEVRGPGVVGEQPILRPGERFEYTSGTPLATPFGIMFGTYQMKTEAGETFAVDIPAFSLDCPHAERLPN